MTLEEIEKERAQYLNNFYFTLFLIILWIVAGVWVYKNFEHINVWVFIGYLILLFVGLKTLHTIPEKFCNEFEYEILKPMFEKNGIVYKPDGSLSEADVQISEIVSEYDEINGRNYINTGLFEMSYFVITKEEEYTETDSDGNETIQTREVTVFTGWLVKHRFYKNAEHKITVTDNSFHLSDVLPIFHDNTRVKMDSPEFEKYFDVYSDDQIGTRVVLTHNFMDDLVEIREKFGVDKFVFIGEYVYHPLSLPDFDYEISLFKKIDENKLDKILLPFFTANEINKYFKGENER